MLQDYQPTLRDVLNVSQGYKKFFVSAIVEDVIRLTSIKGNEYDSVLLRDQTGIIKALKLNPDTDLEVGKVYNFILDTKGHQFTPVCFIKESLLTDIEPSLFKENAELGAKDEKIFENNAEKESLIPHLVKKQLLVQLVRCEIVENFKDQKMKKITLKDPEKNMYYVLKVWPNNQQMYDLDWSEENTDREIFLEKMQVYKKEDSNTAYLKVLPEYSKVTFI